MPLTTLLLLVALATADPAAQTIHVAADGWPQIVAEEPRELGEGESLWSWSSRCAPHRTTASARSDCAPETAVDLRVTTRHRRGAGDAIVRWGTEAMLRELPDALLPAASADGEGCVTLRVPEGEPVYARVAGPALASPWLRLTGPRATLEAEEGVEITLDVRTPDGRPASRARASLRGASAADPREARFRGAGDGIVIIPPVPASGFMRALVWSSDGGPAALTRRATLFPQRITLPAGFTIEGRVADAQDRLVRDVEVSATFIASGEGETITKRASTAADGRFSLHGIAGDTEWRLRKAPFASIAGVVRVLSDADLGTLVLQRTREVRIVVTGAGDVPVEGAILSTPAGERVRTDRNGAAVMRVTSAAADLLVEARGFRSTTAHVEAEAGGPLRVALERAARIRARIVRASGFALAGGGSVAVEMNRRISLHEVAADGIVEIDGLEAGTLSLEVRMPGAAPFRVPPRRIEQGEAVDLGDIVVRPGLAVRGRTIDATTRTAVAGVRVRVPRPGPFGPQLSFVQRDWIEVTSAEDGTFAVVGLAPGTYALWTEAPAHAAYVRSGLMIAGDEVDLGDVELPPATELRVSCAPASRCGSEAAVLIGDAEWLPVSAPLHDGVAVIAPVPPGRVRLRLSDRGGVVHERDVEVTRDGAEVRVRLEGVAVTGVATRGGKPLAGGRVTFATVSGAARFVQLAHRRSAGTIGNEIFGSVPRQYSAAVSDGGHFALADVTPGDYDVTWSVAGGESRPMRTTIAEVADAVVRIDFPAATIRGTVTSAHGALPGSVFITVEQEGRSAKTMATADGTFEVFGLSPGPAAVAASAVRDLSARTSVVIDERAPADVHLLLEPQLTYEVTVAVENEAGVVPNAFVFVRHRGAMRAATTAMDGRATFSLPRYESPLELAVYAPAAGWSFARHALDGRQQTVTMRVSAAAAGLVVTSPVDANAAVAIASPTGFPLHEAFTILGFPSIVRQTAPLRVHGLPAGSYRVMVNGIARGVALREAVESVAF